MVEAMSYLLRVELPDVPGSLGRVASAIGDAGANIDAIEIVAREPGRYAIDDVFIAPDQDVMPDSIVSACTALPGVVVHWISRYAAGGNLFLDLEAVEAMTADPESALARLVDMLPMVFRADWALQVSRDGDGRAAAIVHGTGAAPSEIPPGIDWPEQQERGFRIEAGPAWPDLVLAGSPVADGQLVVLGRRGGPEFLDSEVARLAHLVALAATISRPA